MFEKIRRKDTLFGEGKYFTWNLKVTIMVTVAQEPFLASLFRTINLIHKSYMYAIVEQHKILLVMVMNVTSMYHQDD